MAGRNVSQAPDCTNWTCESVPIRRLDYQGVAVYSVTDILNLLGVSAETRRYIYIYMSMCDDHVRDGMLNHQLISIVCGIIGRNTRSSVQVL